MPSLKRYCLAAVVTLWTYAALGQEPGCAARLGAADRAKFDRAVADYDRGQYRHSAAALKELARRNADNPDLFFYLGLNAVKDGFNVPAIRRNFAKVIRLCPDYPDAAAHYYMALIHYTDNQFEEAAADLNRFFDRANNQATPASDALYMEAANYLRWSQFLAEAYRNQAPFNPRVVGGASSVEDELMPFFTADGQQLFFLRNTLIDDRPTYYIQESAPRRLRLYASQRRDSAFSAGRPLPSPFNQGDAEGGVTLTADGRELFYSVIRRERGYNNSDLYTTTLAGGVWGPARNLGDSVNGMETWEAQPSVSADGQWLYFASNRPGGAGGTDIWRCRRKADGSWSQPQNLGSSVNTPGNEKSPFLHADGHTLYFASDGWQGLGGYDMFFIDLDADGQTFPTNLGVPINGEEDEACYGVMTDGLRAYYAGRPPAAQAVGGTDIMTFELYPLARPEPMRLYRGRVLSPEGRPLPAAITVSHGTSQPARYTADAEGGFSIMISAKRASTVTFAADGFQPVAVAIPASARTASLAPTITLKR